MSHIWMNRVTDGKNKAFFQKGPGNQGSFSKETWRLGLFFTHMHESCRGWHLSPVPIRRVTHVFVLVVLPAVPVRLYSLKSRFPPPTSSSSLPTSASRARCKIAFSQHSAPILVAAASTSLPPHTRCTRWLQVVDAIQSQFRVENSPKFGLFLKRDLAIYGALGPQSSDGGTQPCRFGARDRIEGAGWSELGPHKAACRSCGLNGSLCGLNGSLSLNLTFSVAIYCGGPNSFSSRHVWYMNEACVRSCGMHGRWVCVNESCMNVSWHVTHAVV